MIDADDLTFSATFLKSNIIEDCGKRAYWDWLSDTSEHMPKRKDMALIRAIVETGCLILTTNYDNLIEKEFPDLDSMTWRDTARIQQTIHDGTQAVIHIHGSFKDPNSIIFDADDYQKLNDEPAMKRQLDSLIVDRTLIFLGVGDGLHDDDFGPKLKEFSEVFDKGASRHVLLCTGADLGRLSKELRDTQTRPLVYGDTFEDLPPYIKQAFPQGSLIRSDKAALERIENIMQPIAQCAGVTHPSQIAIPPSFVHNRPPRVSDLTQLNDVDEDYERIEHYPDTRGTVVAAFPDGGLTTALSMVARNLGNTHHLIVHPTVEFREALKFLRNLGEQECVVAIDNVTCQSNDNVHRLDSVISKLQNMPQVRYFILGCKDADLEKISVKLDSKDVSLLHLDQIRPSDVYKMSEKFFELEPHEVQQQKGEIVLKTIQNNNLPHSYSVLCTLFALVAQGQSLRGDINEVQLLNDLVSFQLRRIGNATNSNADDDDLKYMLAILAQMIVENDGSPVSKDDYTSRILHDYASFGKDIDPTEALGHFCDAQWVDWRKNSSPSTLSFYRGCYLALFSAWAPRKLQPGDKQKSFRELLEADLYKYSKIIESMLRLAIQDSSDRDLFVNMLNKCAEDIKSTKSTEPSPQSPQQPKNLLESDDSEEGHRIQKEISKEVDKVNNLVFSMSDVNDHGVGVLRKRHSDDFYLPLMLSSRFLGFSKFLPDITFKKDMLQVVFNAWTEPYYMLAGNDEIRNSITEQLPGVSPLERERIQKVLAGQIVVWQIMDAFRSHEMDNVVKQLIVTSSMSTYTVGIVGYLLAIHPNGWVAELDAFIKKQPSVLRSSFIQDFLLLLLESFYVRREDNLGGKISSQDRDTIWSLICRIIEDGPIIKDMSPNNHNYNKQKILAQLQSQARRYDSD